MRDNVGVVLHGAGDLRVQALPMPEPGPREVLVEMHVVGVCGSDVHFFEHGGIGPFQVRSPLVLGHEPYGEVVGLGAGAGKHRIGDRVVLEPGIPCGRCAQCRAGAYNVCPDVAFLSIPPHDGALARYVTITEDFAHPAPASLSDDAAAMIEPLAVALWAVRRAGLGPASRVLVTGAGPIGLLALQVAIAAGATDVTVTDVRDSALRFASRLGATATLNVSHEPLAFDGLEPTVHLECSGSTVAMAGGIAALAPRGTSVLVGVGPEAAELPVARIRRRELTVTATFRYANCFPDAIALAAAGRVDLESLVTDRYPLARAPEAFAAALAMRGGAESSTIKALIDVV